jgi:hypothetical protein
MKKKKGQGSKIRALECLSEKFYRMYRDKS